MKEMKNKKKKINKKISKIISIISLIGFFVCLIALLYPVVSDVWNRYRDKQLITEYNEAISNSDGDEYEKVFKEAEEYNEYLYQDHKSVVTEAAYEPDEYYDRMLNIMDSGMMGYIEIPVISVNEPIYHYSNEESLGKGIGHIHGSSLPVGGENTHSVLTGHRGLPNQKFFSDLDKVEVGNNFYIHVLGKTLAYEIDDIQTVLPNDVENLMIKDGKDLVTLVTCTPYGVNTHRLLLTGHRIPFDDTKVEDGQVTTEEHKFVIDTTLWVIFGFLLFVIIFLIIITIRRLVALKRKSKEKKTDIEQSS